MHIGGVYILFPINVRESIAGVNISLELNLPSTAQSLPLHI